MSIDFSVFTPDGGVHGFLYGVDDLHAALFAVEKLDGQVAGHIQEFLKEQHFAFDIRGLGLGGNAIDLHGSEEMFFAQVNQIAEQLHRSKPALDPVDILPALEQALCPDAGDGDILRPEVFSGNLAGCLEALKDSDDPAVRALADGELAPLLQNKELLNAYMGLMIGG